MTTVQPCRSLNWLPISRAKLSANPPAGNATTMVIALLGKACDLAGPAPHDDETASTIAIMLVRHAGRITMSSSQ
jgi:hypothetical protein